MIAGYTVAANLASFAAGLWLAVLIPILLPRATILVLQLTGAYRPDKGAPADAETIEKEE